MSWQGNECFIEFIEYKYEECEGAMLDAMDALLWMYGNHGKGWYLLGHFDCNEVEDDYDPFELYGNGSWGSGWLPNPFMHPCVTAINVKHPHDLLGTAFECWDSAFDFIAYAGDGNEPLQHMVIYGEEHDLRACATAA